MVRLGSVEGTSHLFEVGTDKGRIEVLANTRAQMAALEAAFF